MCVPSRKLPQGFIDSRPDEHGDWVKYAEAQAELDERDRIRLRVEAMIERQCTLLFAAFQATNPPPAWIEELIATHIEGSRKTIMHDVVEKVEAKIEERITARLLRIGMDAVEANGSGRLIRASCGSDGTVIITKAYSPSPPGYPAADKMYEIAEPVPEFSPAIGHPEGTQLPIPPCPKCGAILVPDDAFAPFRRVVCHLCNNTEVQYMGPAKDTPRA